MKSESINIEITLKWIGSQIIVNEAPRSCIFRINDNECIVEDVWEIYKHILTVIVVDGDINQACTL